MLKYTAILILLLFLAPYVCLSQKGSTNKGAKAHYDKGERLFAEQQYEDAINEYKKALNSDPNYGDAVFALGDSYAALKNLEQAKFYYEKYVKQFPYKAEALFALGKMYQDNGKYEEAIPNFEKCLGSAPTEDLKPKALKNLNNCRFGAYAVKNPVPFEPKNVGDKINTEVPEYFPSISADEQTFIYSRLVDRRQEDIFITHKENGEWVKGMPISPLINNPDYNEGALCISSNGQYIFFSSNKQDENYGSHDIYFSMLKGNTWSKPYNAGPKINSRWWDSHPSLSADGRTLYFLSTRPGGYGVEDIWYSTLDTADKWTEAKNLGPKINTPYREFTPFIYADGKTLFFSSEGHPGMGGLDIFYSKKDKDGNWGDPVNLGYPINTENIESGFVLSANGKTAFYAAEEKGHPSNIDIYTFPLYPEAQPGAVAYLKGKITDIKTGNIVKARAELIDLETGRSAGAVMNNAMSGEYLICLPPDKNYALNVSSEGYLFYSENFEFKQKPGTEPMQKDIQLKPISGGESIVLNNVFFEVNKADLKPESKIELDRVYALLKNNPSLRLEISGHTDNTGDKISNQKLSENRAKSVVTYLISRGVASGRLEAKGYGDTQPLAPNNSVENKAKNRRTEMKVL